MTFFFSAAWAYFCRICIPMSSCLPFPDITSVIYDSLNSNGDRVILSVYHIFFTSFCWLCMLIQTNEYGFFFYNGPVSPHGPLVSSVLDQYSSCPLSGSKTVWTYQHSFLTALAFLKESPHASQPVSQHHSTVQQYLSEYNLCIFTHLMVTIYRWTNDKTHICCFRLITLHCDTSYCSNAPSVLFGVTHTRSSADTWSIKLM